MDCPNCDEPCEREYYGHIAEGGGPYIPPSTEYRCPSCDWTAVWVLYQRLRIVFDPRVENGEDPDETTSDEEA